MEVERHMKKNQKPVEFAEDTAANIVTITIRGQAFENLGILARGLTNDHYTFAGLGYRMPKNGVSRAFVAELLSDRLTTLPGADGLGESAKFLADGDVDKLARLLACAALSH